MWPKDHLHTNFFYNYLNNNNNIHLYYWLHDIENLNFLITGNFQNGIILI